MPSSMSCTVSEHAGPLLPARRRRADAAAPAPRARPICASSSAAAIYAARQHGRSRTSVTVSIEDGETVARRAPRARVRAAELAQGALLVMFDGSARVERDAAAGAGATIEPVVREMEDELDRTRDQLRVDDRAVRDVARGAQGVERGAPGDQRGAALGDRGARDQQGGAPVGQRGADDASTTSSNVKVDEISHANSRPAEPHDVDGDRRDLPGPRARHQALHAARPRPVQHHPVRPRPAAVAPHAPARARPISPRSRARVLTTLRGVERQGPDRDGRSYLVRWLPYRSLDDRIEGVVITFVDVSDLRDAVDGAPPQRGGAARGRGAAAHRAARGAGRRAQLRRAAAADLGLRARATRSRATRPTARDVRATADGDRSRALVRRVSRRARGQRARARARASAPDRGRSTSASSRAPARRDGRRLRHHAEQARGDGAARRRSPQGRVPRDAVARAAQSARAAARSRSTSRGSSTTTRRSARRASAVMERQVAMLSHARRRAPRSVAHHAGQARAARASPSISRACSSARSRRPRPLSSRQPPRSTSRSRRHARDRRRSRAARAGVREPARRTPRSTRRPGGARRRSRRRRIGPRPRRGPRSPTTASASRRDMLPHIFEIFVQSRDARRARAGRARHRPERRPAARRAARRCGERGERRRRARAARSRSTCRCCATTRTADDGPHERSQDPGRRRPPRLRRGRDPAVPRARPRGARRDIGDRRPRRGDAVRTGHRRARHRHAGHQRLRRRAPAPHPLRRHGLPGRADRLGQPADRARAFAAGFDLHVVKPANAATMRGIISAAEAALARRVSAGA